MPLVVFTYSIGAVRPEEGLFALLAIIAAILFAVAFILQVTSTAPDAVISPISLALLGLTLLALHQAGMGPGYSFSRRRRR